MLQETATVSDVIARFREELKHKYPEREIEQFLVMAFEEVMHIDKIDVFLRTKAPISKPQKAHFEGILEGLLNDEPIQYLLGHAHFYGLPFQVNTSVLIPRPETEELVQWVLKDRLPDAPRILDLGTGSGCIAIALKHGMPRAQVLGIDVSVAALNLANQNASRNKLQVEFFHFDLLRQESLGFMDFDVMVSNPPYVTPTEMEEMDANVLNYEPHEALFVPEDDPLLFYRKIVDLADGHLNRGGKLYFEINRAFGNDLAQLLRDRNYQQVELRKDLSGNDRMIRAVKS